MVSDPSLEAWIDGSFDEETERSWMMEALSQTSSHGISFTFITMMLNCLAKEMIKVRASAMSGFVYETLAQDFESSLPSTIQDKLGPVEGLRVLVHDLRLLGSTISFWRTHGLRLASIWSECLEGELRKPHAAAAEKRKWNSEPNHRSNRTFPIFFSKIKLARKPQLHCSQTYWCIGCFSDPTFLVSSSLGGLDYRFFSLNQEHCSYPYFQHFNYRQHQENTGILPIQCESLPCHRLPMH